MKSFIKQKKYLIFFMLISLIALKFFELPINIYQIYKTNHENRLEKFYGYCYPNGYGFIKELKKKFNKLNNIKTINFEDFANSNYFFNRPYLEYETNYLILINFDKNLKSNINFLKNSSIIYQKDNCYLIKND
ncbi:hypothetical protein OAJ75_05195 [Candidatus Pelagibacter sp.]|nr:hypothetical protein [Candidatus Pelagibacter sp.]